MQTMEESRQILNGIDREMAELFRRRMDTVREIARYKKEHGLPVLDAQREAALLERNAAYVEDPVLRAYYLSFLQGVMDVSKQYQHRILDGMRVACSGVEGAFAHIAAKGIFPSGNFAFYPDFRAAYESVEQGACDCCVLPIENSYAGEVTQVTDLLCAGSLFINGIYDLEICHNLLGLPEARLRDICTVISHPQALSQCEGYIRAHGFTTVSQSNTAISARIVAESGDKTMAAIASRETAELYGLKILDHDINASLANTTRFAVFSRVENPSTEPDSRFVMVFTVRNEAGALAEAIRIIGNHGYNMRVLRSRPIQSEPWQYYFYVEAEGNAYGDRARAMLQELSGQCSRVKIVGSFRREEKLTC